MNGFVDSTLAAHTLASLVRIFAALIASVAIGMPAGLAIGTSRVGKGILDPIVEFLRPLPPLGYLPLIVIWMRRMLTLKWRCLATAGEVEDDRLMLTIIVGGSTDKAVAEVTVAPVRSSPRPAVITETVPAAWRVAVFNSPDAEMGCVFDKVAIVTGLSL